MTGTWPGRHMHFGRNVGSRSWEKEGETATWCLGALRVLGTPSIIAGTPNSTGHPMCKEIRSSEYDLDCFTRSFTMMPWKWDSVYSAAVLLVELTLGLVSVRGEAAPVVHASNNSRSPFSMAPTMPFYTPSDVTQVLSYGERFASHISWRSTAGLCTVV